MKFLATLIVSLVTISASAQHRHHHHHPVYPSRHYDWVAPLVIGGIAGYAIANRPAPPVVVQTPPNYVYSNPPDLIYIDGVAYRRERMYINGVWQDVLVRL